MCRGTLIRLFLFLLINNCFYIQLTQNKKKIEAKVHEGHNVKRFRKILGIKQEAFAYTVLNQHSWYYYGGLKQYLDKAIESGEITPMIVVTPDANFETKRISY